MTAPFSRPRRGTGRALITAAGRLELPEGQQLVGLAGDCVRTAVNLCPSCSHDADLHSASWGCVKTLDGDECGCMRLRSLILADVGQAS